MSQTQRMDVVVVGHVDHGKSTVIGRLMADTGSLPEGRLEDIKAMCARNARPFEYAFLLDALKNERAQGITIDTARCFFNTENRHYIIHDAPGHVEFLKNMITGASRAQAALLVIDAHEGVKENSKRHGYILSMLGIRQISVLVNKMDLHGWDQAAFDAVVEEYSAFLGRLGVHPQSFIPISAREGDNIVTRGEAAWYTGPTVLEQVEAFSLADDQASRPFRMPLQDVYKFTAEGDDRRIFAGTVETGRVRPGDEVVFLPSGKRSRVATLEVLEGERPREAHAGQATGFTVDTQVYAKPGELVVRAEEPQPVVTQRFRATVFWMAVAPLSQARRYTLRIGTAKVPVELERVTSVLDASELSSVSGAAQVERHDVAEVVLRTTRPVALDPADVIEQTSRFVIVDNYNIAGCGIALEPLADEDVAGGRRIYTPGLVTASERTRRYRHGGKVVVVISDDSARADEIATHLERRLFDLGAHSYFLGGAHIGAGRDVLARDSLVEHFGETSMALADAGVVFVGSLTDIDRFDLGRIASLNRTHTPFVVDAGRVPADVDADVRIGPDEGSDDAVVTIVRALTETGVLPEYTI